MAEEVLDIVAEEPEEQHVAKQVCGAAVKKHASEKRKQRDFKVGVAGAEVIKSKGDSAVHGSQCGLRFVRNSQLVDDHTCVCTNEGVVFVGRSTARTLVRTWNSGL